MVLTNESFFFKESYRDETERQTVTSPYNLPAQNINTVQQYTVKLIKFIFIHSMLTDWKHSSQRQEKREAIWYTSTPWK
jgi:hypothetical protein